jgi:predicted enzyme related to lactoylglutathione lyase
MALDPARPGAFCWTELAADDLAVAQDFYTDIFGWTLTSVSEEPPYFEASVADIRIAGMMPNPVRDKGVPSHWLAYVAVQDIEKAVAKAESIGAAVHHPPHTINEVGRFAVIADPRGAALALFEPIMKFTPWPDDLQSRHGCVSWYELWTDELDPVKTFYAELFGWEFSEWEGGPMPYTMVGLPGEQPQAGMFVKPAEMAGIPNCWAVYVNVDDVKKTRDAVVEKGGTILQEPTPIPSVGTIITFTDPQGASLCAIEMEK